MDWYARELMRLPFRFEVRKPEALRGEIARIARELLEQFGESAPDGNQSSKRSVRLKVPVNARPVRARVPR